MFAADAADSDDEDDEVADETEAAAEERAAVEAMVRSALLSDRPAPRGD